MPMFSPKRTAEDIGCFYGNQNIYLHFWWCNDFTNWRLAVFFKKAVLIPPYFTLHFLPSMVIWVSRLSTLKVFTCVPIQMLHLLKDVDYESLRRSNQASLNGMDDMLWNVTTVWKQNKVHRMYKNLHFGPFNIHDKKY